MTRTVRKWGWTLAFAGLGVSLWLVMAEIDSLLQATESVGNRDYGMSALQGLRLQGSSGVNALTLWRQATDGNAINLLHVYLVLDTFVAVLYTLALIALLRAIYPDPSRLWLVGLGAGVADVAENIWTYLASYGPTAANWLPVASGVKWLFVIASLVAIGWGLVQKALLRPYHPHWTAVAWHFRVQYLAVGLLGFAVAVPSQDRLGAMQQLPDIIRTYADLPPGVVTWLAASTGALVLFAAAIWVSGHWLYFRTEGQAPPSPRQRERQWWLILGLAVLSALWGITLWLGLVGVHTPSWAKRNDVSGAAFIAAGVFLVLWLVHRLGRNTSVAPEPHVWRAEHGYVLNTLVALSVMIAGLGLVRAYAVTLMVARSAAPADPSFKLDVVFLFVGLATATVVPVLILFGLSYLNSKELGEDARPRQVPTWLTVVTMLVAVGTVVAFSLAPERIGPIFGANGVLGLAVAVGCVLASAVVAMSQRSAPLVHYWNDAQGLMSRRPVAMPTLLLILVMVVTLGPTDSISTYHDVRNQAAGSTQPTVTLEEAFESWASTAGGCGTSVESGQQRVQPMLIISAAGGGIRAAFWTEAVLEALTDVMPAVPGRSREQTAECARNSVFLVSSVSGGSLGSALWASTSAARLDDLPGGPRSGLAAGAAQLADGKALAALGAAWLFRDSVRMLTLSSPNWHDRATVMEQLWSDELGPGYRRLSDPFRPIAGPANALDQWRPLLMLNGTDLLTNCRVVITALRETDPGNALDDCDSNTRPTNALPGTYYASQFDDDASCHPDRPMSSATAALLSARFPFVTPTGSLYFCADDGEKDGDRVRRLQIGDGGYLDSSGMLTALDQWHAVQPLVDDHNNGRRADGTLAGALIVPMFIEISNDYISTATLPVASRQSELRAPIQGSSAALELTSGDRIRGEVRAAFPDRTPGSTDCPPIARTITLAPTLRPEISAPLGWALSERSRETMLEQVNRLEPQLGPIRALLTGACTVAAPGPPPTP